MTQQKTRRVTFSFDDRSYESVEKMGRQGRFAEACNRDGFIKHVCFPKPEPTGHKEISITNPETGESRVLIIPTFD